MIDVNKPVTNPELIAAIETMHKNNTEATCAHTLECLLTAHFLAPVIISPEPQKSGEGDGTAVISKGTQISFPMLYKHEREAYYFVFTDWAELGKWQKNENQQTLIVTFKDISSLAVTAKDVHGVVINPFGNSLSFRNDEIKGILGI